MEMISEAILDQIWNHNDETFYIALTYHACPDHELQHHIPLTFGHTELFD